MQFISRKSVNNIESAAEQFYFNPDQSAKTNHHNNFKDSFWLCKKTARCRRWSRLIRQSFALKLILLAQ